MLLKHETAKQSIMNNIYHSDDFAQGGWVGEEKQEGGGGKLVCQGVGVGKGVDRPARLQVWPC